MMIFVYSAILVFIGIKMWDHVKYMYQVRINRFYFFYPMSFMQSQLFGLSSILYYLTKCFGYKILYRYLLLECIFFPSLAKNRINIIDNEFFGDGNVRTIKGFRVKSLWKNLVVTKNSFNNYFLVYVNPRSIQILAQNIDLCLFCLYVSPASFSFITIVNSPSYEETVKNLNQKKKLFSLIGEA